MDCKRRRVGFALLIKLPAVSKRAFTLIELLIVIAVIAVLLSILLPTLQHTMYLAQRASCLSNISQQHTAQMSYAAEWHGKFPPRIDCGADYVRVFGDNTGPWYGLTQAGKYLQDTQIMICPLLTHFGGIYADPDFYYPQWPDYGSWGANRTYVISAYAWFANYGHWSIFAEDEPRWPSNTAECDKSRAFISHRITYSPVNSLFDDWGHLGSDRSGPNSGDFQELSTIPDQPVGYGDGHIEIHPKSQVHARTIGGGWYSAEWYY